MPAWLSPALGVRRSAGASITAANDGTAPVDSSRSLVPVLRGEAESPGGAAVDRQGWQSLEQIRSPDLVGARSPQGRQKPWDAWHLCRATALGTGGVVPALPVQGLTSMAGDRRTQGLNRPIPDCLSGETGTIRAFLNPRTAARTIGSTAISAGSTPVVALLRRSCNRRSTLGSLAP